MADLEYDSAIPLVQPFLNSYDGNNHSITIVDVADFPGLFGDTDGVTISNLVINSDNSTTAIGAGWLANQDDNSTFSNIVVNAPISIQGGGIVGRHANGTQISRSASTGAIGYEGGGLVGSDADDVSVNNSFSVGLINFDAGGIVGARAGASAPGQVTVEDSFSTGYISMGAGGIIGALSARELFSTVVVRNSYATGEIDVYAGGIFGTDSGTGGAALVVTNSYSSGSVSDNAGAFANASPTLIASNSYGALGSWSDLIANTNLTGVPLGIGDVGTSWGSCGTNLPYFIASFYSINPCIAALTTNIQVSGTDPSLSLSQASVDGPTGNSFSLTSVVSSSPFSYVSLVNQTGSVTLGGTPCVQVSSCQIRDVLQGPYSRGRFTITGDGTVSVVRFNSFTGDSSTVGTLSVSRIRVAAPEAAKHIVTLNPNGGACGASSVTVSNGSSILLPNDQSCTKSGFSFAGWFDESGSRVLASELVVTSDRTLSAHWTADSPKPSSMVRNRISARISRLALDAQVVRVRGRIIGTAKTSNLQVWFKESGMKEFVKSSSPLIRKGRQFTWFHHTSKGIRVYVLANGAEQSKTLRTTGQK